MWTDISIIAALLLLNAFFAMSELAVVSASKPLLRQAAQKGSRRATLALHLAENPGRFLSTVQIGITLVGIIAGAYGGANFADDVAEPLRQIPLLAPYSQTIAVSLVIAIITYFSVVVGELIPKQLGLTRADSLCLIVAPPMYMLSRICTPVVALLEFSASSLMRLLRISVEEEQMTETEIRAVLAEGVASGAIEAEEQQVIQRVIRLGDRDVTSIMTHRSEVSALDINDGFAAVLEKVKAAPHSRFPVIDGDITRVIGVVAAKDLLSLAVDATAGFDLRAHMKEMLFVSDATSCLDALQKFRNEHVSIAAVIDEYGAFEGLFTQADLLESVVGIIRSNYDAAEDQLIVRREDGSWLVDGMTAIDEVSMALDIEGLDGSGEYQTIAGFVLSQLKAGPTTGAAVDFAGHRFEIVDMDRHRIDKLLIIRHAPQTTEDAGA